jgi:membrane associated rhomboid family serine protease
MNSAALLETGGLVVARLGSYPLGWLRFLVAFGLGAIGALVFFLLTHPGGKELMIGASGAVFALLGLLLSIRLIEELEPVPVNLLPRAAMNFVQENSFFLALIVVGAIAAALPERVSWQAHLGGFASGLCLGPWLLPKRWRDSRLFGNDGIDV